MPEQQPTHMNMKRGRPRDADIHQRIIDVAFRVLQKDGYRATTLKHIANESKVSRQSIYRRWPNKAWLFFEVLTDQVLKSPLNAPPSSISLEEYLYGLLALGRERTGKIISSIFIEAQEDPVLFEKLQDLSRARRRVLEQVIEADARRRGYALTKSPALIAEVLTGTMWFRLVLGLEVADERHVGELVNMMQAFYIKEAGKQEA